MRKLLVLFTALFTTLLLTVSCSLNQIENGSISFSCDSLCKAINSREIINEEDTYTILVKLTGDIQRTKSLSISGTDLLSYKVPSISFEDLPVDSTVQFTIKVIDFEDFVIYSGESDFVKIQSGENSVNVKLILSYIEADNYFFYGNDSVSVLQITDTETTLEGLKDILEEPVLKSKLNKYDNVVLNISDLNINTISAFGEEGSEYSIFTPFYAIQFPYTVTKIDKKAFFNCKKLSLLIYQEGKYELDSLTEVGNFAFSGCSKLMTIDAPKLTNIGASAFKDCSSMLYASFSHKATVQRNSFEGCNLTSVTFTMYDYSGVNHPLTMEKLGTTVCVYPTVITDDNFQLFMGSENTHLVSCISNFEKIVDTTNCSYYIDFSECTSLTKLSYNGKTNGQEGSLLTKFSTIIFPPSLTEIGTYAFYNCTKLTSILIPETVTKIGSYAFNGCSNLLMVSFKDTSSAWKVVTTNEQTIFPGTQTAVNNAQSLKNGDLSTTDWIKN